MSIGSIGNVPQSNQNTPASQQSLNSLNADFDFFLQLLTTQLQNQDPTEPLDPNQLTDQITQFTQVEQQIRTNQLFETLIDGQNQSQLSTAVSFIGSEVETEGNTGELIGGRAVFSYMLDGVASNTQVTVSDANGRAVFQGPGTNVNGRNLVVWDGVNSFTNQLEPNGLYTLTVTAQTPSGQAVPVDVRAVGLVTAVETDADNQVTLTISDQQVPLDEILAVRTPFFAQQPASDGEQESADAGNENEDNGGNG